ERTHRLRIDPAPFRSLREELSAEPFDRLMAFLEARDFRPAVNHLEATLAGLARDLGVEREIAEVGSGVGQVDLATLRHRLEADGRLQTSAPLAIVAADSVHSGTRELVCGSEPAVEQIHHAVARLRLTGPGLPPRLGYAETFRFAKVLGSALDYRLNANGYAEVDLFLGRAEHAQMEALRATPRQPVPLAAHHVSDAPFLAAVVGGFAAGFGAGPCTVELQSTFRLEHRYQPSVVFPATNADATVLLVGDAAISLPFFRGMAALTACVRELAAVQAAWANAVVDGDAGAGQILDRYQSGVERIRERELHIVAARSRLVGVAREFVRLSTLMPFPIQQWFLSTSHQTRRGGRLSGGAALNILVATLAGFVALAAPLVGGLVWAPLGWAWFGAVPLQFLGGVVYGATQSHEPEPNPLLAAIWRLQIAFLLIAGLPITLFTSVLQGRPAQIFGAVGWFLLGFVFAAGLVVYERVEGHRFEAGAFDQT
ncbi:MAG: hypothetical protein OEM97_11585, partial [Acidimicrobiia bacterium]|nr:hypothetical protein [Acidimicrobiia bacterium]